MDSGWTKSLDDPDKSRPESTLQIRSTTIWRRLTIGTVSRLGDSSEPGFWFLTLSGTKFHLSGKW